MKCPYCGGEAKLRKATDIYPNTPKARGWGYMWACENYPKCDTYVGCHKGTTIPKGRLANPRLRTLKKEAHRQFDPLWKSGLLTRKEAYKWLADQLKISIDDCHIGMFDVSQCQKVIHLCREQNNPMVNEYRKAHDINTHRPIFTKGYHPKKNS